MDELKLIFASNLIRLRTAAGMTQAELGEQLNYSDKSISKWERGEAIPDAAVLKRMEGSQNTAAYRDAEVNFSKGTISKGDQEMVLTKNEMIIFQLLLSNREKIVSRDEIMTDLWDNDEFVNDNALTVNISRLRGKLADLGYDDAIETRKKQGYRLV